SHPTPRRSPRAPKPRSKGVLPRPAIQLSTTLRSVPSRSLGAGGGRASCIHASRSSSSQERLRVVRCPCSRAVPSSRRDDRESGSSHPEKHATVPLVSTTPPATPTADLETRSPTRDQRVPT